MKRVPNQSLDYREDDLYYHDDEPFTGVAYFLDKAGRLKAEHEYRNGMRWGISKGWQGGGAPDYEESWSQGLLHGLHREWSEIGRCVAEEMYEYGICLWAKRWDDAGEMIQETELKETDPDFETLTIYRSAYKKAGLADGTAQRPFDREGGQA